MKKEEEKKNVKKYTVRPPKDLTSKFTRKQEQRKVKERELEEEKLKKEEEAKQAVSYCDHTTTALQSSLLSHL